jgi:hypothetical protein
VDLAISARRTSRGESIETISGVYLDLLLGEGATQIISLIQAHNLQVIFKSGESLIFMFFFFLI